MKELESRIHDENNGLDYVLVGDYYIPVLELPVEHRPIGRFGRLHRDYLKSVNPIRYNQLALSGKLFTYLADLNEQAENRMEIIIRQIGIVNKSLVPSARRIMQQQYSGKVPA